MEKPIKADDIEMIQGVPAGQPVYMPGPGMPPPQQQPMPPGQPPMMMQPPAGMQPGMQPGM